MPQETNWSKFTPSIKRMHSGSNGAAFYYLETLYLTCVLETRITKEVRSNQGRVNMFRIIMISILLMTPSIVASQSAEEVLKRFLIPKLKEGLQRELDDLTGMEEETVPSQPIVDNPLLVSLRPQRKPFLEPTQSVRRPLKNRHFNRAIIAVCGEGLFLLTSCAEARERLEYYASGCRSMRTFIMILQPNAQVNTNWFRSNLERPRNPNLILFTREQGGRLHERYVSGNPTRQEMHRALGCG